MCVCVRGYIEKNNYDFSRTVFSRLALIFNMFSMYSIKGRKKLHANKILAQTRIKTVRNIRREQKNAEKHPIFC
jgi:hypothetical protein